MTTICALGVRRASRSPSAGWRLRPVLAILPPVTPKLPAAQPPELADQIIVEALRRGQIVRLRAVSRSMAPAIVPGDLLLVRDEPLGAGDIAVYWRQGAWVTHRVRALREGGYDVSADSAPSAIEFVASGQVVGKVLSVRHEWFRWRQRLRRVLAWVRNRVRAQAA